MLVLLLLREAPQQRQPAQIRRPRRAPSLPSPSRPLPGSNHPAPDLRVPLPRHDADPPPIRSPIRRRLLRRRLRLGGGSRMRRGDHQARAPRRRSVLPNLQGPGAVPRHGSRPHEALSSREGDVAGGSALRGGESRGVGE